MTSLEVRPPREEETPAIVQLFNEISLAAHGTADTDEDEIRLWFTSPHVDPARDTRVVSLNGSLVGYGDVSEEGGKIWLDVREHPGVGDGSAARAALHDLTPRARELARERALESPALRAWVASIDEPVKAMLEREGFALVRKSFRMEIDLADEPPEPDLPPGVHIQTFQPGQERVVFDVQKEGFADMWEYAPSPFEGWLHFMIKAADFDPTLWFLAVEGDEVTGLALCRPHRPGDPEQGWVRVLCVRPAWRRRGIALALLRHAFREFRSRGLRRAGLGVDGESATGALELYERAGMRVIQQHDIYDRAL